MCDETKKCSKCGEVKSLSEFSPSQRCAGGRHSWCKDCNAASMREHHAVTRARHESGELQTAEFSTCCTCKIEKPAREFGPDLTKKNGLNSQCRSCSRAGKMQLKAKKTGSPGQYDSLLEDQLIELHNSRCVACSCEVDKYAEKFFASKMEFDHMTPTSVGGSDDISNICIMCHTCNNAKKGRSLETFIGPLRAAKVRAISQSLSSDQRCIDHDTRIAEKMHRQHCEFVMMSLELDIESACDDFENKRNERQQREREEQAEQERKDQNFAAWEATGELSEEDINAGLLFPVT